MAALSAEQLARIESLGLNCEVGNVLRRYGNETPSLFRWTWAPPKAILDLLGTDFADLYSPENMSPGPHNELLDRRHGIWFHTNLRTGDPDGGQAYRFLDPDEKARLRILKAERSLVEALVERFRKRMQTSDVLYVLTRHACEPDGSAADIAGKIRARAGQLPFTLLEVREAPEPRMISKIETVADGLLRGYVSRFAPYDAAHDIDLASWTPLLEAALAMTEARPWWRPRRASHAAG